MDKQKQIEEMAKDIANSGVFMVTDPNTIARVVIDLGYRKIPENAVVLTDDELNEVIDTCKVSMIVIDDDGEKYISLDDHNEYTERLGKIVRQRKARIEQLEKLLDDRCDHCIERERRGTAEKFAKLADDKSVYFNMGGTFYKVVHFEDIGEICKEITEG